MLEEPDLLIRTRNVHFDSVAEFVILVVVRGYTLTCVTRQRVLLQWCLGHDILVLHVASNKGLVLTTLALKSSQLLLS
jgi:hypothetical protein